MPIEPRSLKELFLAALAVAPAERAAWLESECAQDAELRRRVELMLAAHDSPQSLLDRLAPGNNPPEPATGALASAKGEPSSPADREQPGTLLAGRYKLLEQIGEGGMGSVWMAQQTEPIKRLVALKIIKPGMDSKQVIARFEAERQALALMDHPNIAKVHDAGTTGSEPDALARDSAATLAHASGSVGRPYFVMELVKGVPITKYCDEHRLTPRQRLELFVPVCHAIQHAHHKGIIHRDIKPSNVLVALYDDKPVPKVIDFGVAKATGQQLTEQTLHTGFGAVVGTVEYMSPEQASFNQLDVDTRSDIYSLGVLLYELLAGSPPFTRSELEKAGVLEMLRVIREQEPTKPSTKLSTAEGLPTLAANRGTEPAKLTRLVRGELDWIVMKALEKDRSRRYETANGFVMDVQRYLADEPVQACPPSAWYRLRKFARRNKARVVVAAGVLLAVTVMAATIGWAVGDRAARRATAAVEVRDSLNIARVLIAENKLAAARRKLGEARARLGEDHSALSDLAAEVEVGQAELDRFEQFLDLIERAHQADMPVLEAALAADSPGGRAETVPTTSVGKRRPEAQVPLLLQALQQYEVLGRDDWKTTMEVTLLGRDQLEYIRRSAYEELLRLAADVLRRKEEHHSRQKLSAAAAARQALVYLEKAESAHRPTRGLYVLRARCRMALDEQAGAQADRQRAEQTAPTMAMDHTLRGREAYDAKQLPEAVQAFEAALRLEPTNFWSLMWLGMCLCDLGRGSEDFAGAARVFTGCILKRPDHAHAYACRALAYRKLGRYPEALADCSNALDLDPKHADAWRLRGVAYDYLGQHDKALADMSKAIELPPKHALAWSNRGAVYCDHLAQYDKALADFSKAIELDPKEAWYWHNRGVAYRKQGQPHKALADYSKAIELDPNHAIWWNTRGAIYCDHLGQYDKALADFSKAIELDAMYAEAWRNRGLAYGKQGQPNKEIAELSRAIQLDPKEPRSWSERGRVYGQLGQPDKAIADCCKAIELNPKDARTWSHRGMAYLALGQWDKAVTDCSKAIELDANLAPAWSNRGMARMHLRQLRKAVDDCSKAIELDPKLAEPWANRAGAYFYLGQADKAVVDCSKTIELAPRDPRLVHVYLLRAQANYQLGRFARVSGDFESVLKTAPKNASALNQLAWLLATCPEPKLRDPRQAVKLASKAVEVAPNAADNWNTLGVAHYRAGDWKAAVAALGKSVELSQRGGDAVDQLFLAMAHQQLGKRDEARKAYDQAVQWLEKNKETLEKDKPHAEELRRFRSEAEEVLELKKK